MTTPQFQALALIGAEPGISSADLARRCEVTAQTIMDVVRNLERARLVEREAHSEHGRIMTLRLTEHGLTMLERCQRLVARVERQMLAPFSQAERAAFVAALLQAGDALLAGRPRRRSRPNA